MGVLARAAVAANYAVAAWQDRFVAAVVGTDAAAHPVTGNANGQASVSAVSIRGGYGAAALMVGV